MKIAWDEYLPDAKLGRVIRDDKSGIPAYQSQDGGKPPIIRSTTKPSLVIVGGLAAAVWVFLSTTALGNAVAYVPSSAAASQPASAAVDPDVHETCLELERRIGEANEPTMTGQAAVDAARCRIVNRCAKPLSALLAGCGPAGESLALEASKGLAHLEKAAGQLALISEESQEVGPLRDRIELLQAFGQTFAALGADGAGEEADKQLLATCNRLGPYLDDPDEEIAESAKLWQGAAYRRGGRPERALQVLRPVITVPASRRIGLLSRLERCRALGETGNHVAGIALCDRLAARVDAWLAEEDESTRKQAADTIRFVRIGLLKDWAVKLRQGGQVERARQAEQEAKRELGADVWPPPCGRWLVLDESIAGSLQTEKYEVLPPRDGIDGGAADTAD